MRIIRKELKKTARHSVKSHYGLFLLICLAAAVIGSEFTSSLTLIKWQVAGLEEEHTTINQSDGLNDAINKLILDGDTVSEPPKESLLDSVFSPTKGVLAEIVNTISSGHISVRMVEVVNSVVHSENLANTILIGISFIFVLAFWFFIQNLFTVVNRRIFLEGGTYQKVSIKRALFIWSSGKLWKTAVNMAYVYILKCLWALTIVGYIIKRYSYFMVPYILAENPDMSARAAVTLSRKIMNGHKWQCFLLELSFIGWWFLGTITGGLVDLFYVNSYSTATFCEYYKSVRAAAIDARINGCEALNDKYLFAVADGALLFTAYGKTPKSVKLPELKGFRKFCSDYLGISFWDDKTEEQYINAQKAAVREERIKNEREGLAYPEVLSPLYNNGKKDAPDSAGYLRHYPLQNLILMFFIFCMVGWIWEVALHFVVEGNFVNRGSLHGPWLPIYGSGGMMILILLNKFRKKPWLEFTLTVVLCGVLEYFTSYFMELANGGIRWWDYTGYFLNLDGRICAEGLLTFGMGGLAAVYIIAPQLDNLLQRLNKKLAICLSAGLLVLFVSDVIYSGFVPNMGEGITDQPHTTSAVVENTESSIIAGD